MKGRKMKTLKGLTLAAVVCMSSQAFSSVSLRTLDCGAPKSNTGNMILGVGYKIQISSGFDTHVRNPDGTVGKGWGPAFRLVSQVVSPSAQPTVEVLKLVSRDANGSYDLTGQNETVTVSNNLNRAIVSFNNSATAICD
jgi:hypothetical protein